jgi:hypothetical protein
MKHAAGPVHYVALVALLAAGSAGGQEGPAGAFLQSWTLPGDWCGVAADPGGAVVYGLTKQGQCVRVNAAGEKGAEFTLREKAKVLRAGVRKAGGTFLVAGGSKWVAVYDTEGKPLWTRDTGGTVLDLCPADLDGDGESEVIAGFLGAEGLKAFAADGSIRWENKTIGKVWSVSAGDVDESPGLEIVATSSAGKVHVFSSAGKTLKDLDPLYFASQARCALGAEGAMTIMVAGQAGPEDRRLVSLNTRGQELWRSPNFFGTDKTNLDRGEFERRSGLFAVARGEDYVAVLERATGKLIGEITIGDEIRHVAWLVAKDGSPRLLLATDQSLQAFSKRR